MKKSTKLTALVLALALVLGMTSFAAVEVTKSVDFSIYADKAAFDAAGNIDATKKDGSTTFNTFTKGDSFTFGTAEGNLAYNKLYYGVYKTPLITPVNGKNALVLGANRTNTSDGLYRQFALTFPEAWEYNEEKAFVVQTGFIPTKINATASKYLQVNKPGFVGGFVTTTDGTTETNAIGAFVGLKMTKNADVTLLTGGQTYIATPGNEFGETVLKNQEAYITTVIRPYDLHGENVPAIEEGQVGSLNIINNFDRSWDKVYHSGQKSYSCYHTPDGAPITKVHGLTYSQGYFMEYVYTGYRMYEVSLNPADFTITSAKTLSDVATNGAVTIEFSQPISTNLSDPLSGNTPDPKKLLEEIEVKKGEETLTLNEDYTIEVVEKSSGNTIWDAIVVTPVGDWNMGAEYAITLPNDIKNIARVGMADTNKTVTFTTEASSEYTMTLNAYKGLDATGTPLNAIEDGTTYFTVAAALKSGNTVANGTLRLVIKDASGNAVKSVAVKKALGNGASFGVALKGLEAGMTATATIDGVPGTDSID